LTHLTVQFFRNFVDPQTIAIEDDLTVFLGKNESGKTTILRALHRLNPANPDDGVFDLRAEYPRWRLAPDRRNNPDILDLEPISAAFSLDEADCIYLADFLPAKPPVGAICTAARSYANKRRIELRADLREVVADVAAQTDVNGLALDALLALETVDAVIELATGLAKQNKVGHDAAARSTALSSFASAVRDRAYLVGGADLDAAATAALWERVPRFFYFSSYENLPGECDLTNLAGKIAAGAAITPQERTVVALLAHADEQPKDFLHEDYDSRKAELQAASADLSRRAFEYWGQNRDLTVVFDTDNVRVGVDAKRAGVDAMHRILKIQLRDCRHGDIETNFEARSAGFRWFFSFFAAFSEYQDSADRLIMLLDEPGTSLHGEAQRDFVRFVSDELAASKQTLYTTHSQHMVDPRTYEKLRAVHDRATRANPDLAVVVTRVDRAEDRDTILPIESALGCAVSRQLLDGPGQQLAVAQSREVVFMQRLCEHLWRSGDEAAALGPSLTPVALGGAEQIPAFVALIGRHRPISVLVHGTPESSGLSRIKAAARANGIPVSSLVVCADADGSLPPSADLEDLFALEDYLRLYNWAFDTTVGAKDLPNTREPVLGRLEAAFGPFDPAAPAQALTEHRGEFFSDIDPGTVARFKALFALLNATLRPLDAPPTIADELEALSGPGRRVMIRESRRERPAFTR